MVYPTDPVVDLNFLVRGRSVPVDHGYSLYGAVCRALPWLHAADGVGVHPIRGRLTGSRALALTRASRLSVRCPVTRLHETLPLAGQSLELDGDLIQVGVPTVQALTPAPALASRLVVIKGFTEPEPFLDAARRQLAALGIEAEPALIARRDPASREGKTDQAQGAPIRRTLRIHDKQIVGFALAVTGLTAEESIRLQEHGLGGRRRFGCGIFLPQRTRPG